MLSLGRNTGQYVVVNGKIVIQLVAVDGMLRLAIDAQKEIQIEILQQVYSPWAAVQASL